MSDIYLSITETPTVVTLTNPLISSNVAQSVTVTNVVSVNVVTMPAITVQAAAPSVTTVVGTVAVSNFPASSSVTIGGFSTSSLPPSTVTVANSVTINGTVTASQFFTVVTSQTISFASTVTSTEAFNTGTDYDFVLMQTNLFNGGNLGTVYIDRYTSPTGSGGSGNYSLWDDTNKKAFIGGTGNNLCMDGNSIITLLQTGFPSQFYYRFRTVDATGGISGSAKLYAIKSIYPYSASIFKPWDLGKVPVAGNVYLTNSTITVGNSVTIGSLPAISGTVTVGAMPSGSLTTRFGTPTTANTAFATSAVTNANRKYLLIQNVTTGSNVITVGIGFTPTTTQGIQLTAGAGITFESSYIPTGQIFVLSSVTASNFTILEA